MAMKKDKYGNVDYEVAQKLDGLKIEHLFDAG